MDGWNRDNYRKQFGRWSNFFFPGHDHRKRQRVWETSARWLLFFLILDDRLRSGFNTSENRIDKIEHHYDGAYQQAVRKSGYEFWHWIQELFNSYFWLRIDSRIRYFHRSDRFLLCSGNLRCRDILKVRIFSWNCHDFVWQKSPLVPLSVHSLKTLSCFHL